MHRKLKNVDTLFRQFSHKQRYPIRKACFWTLNQTFKDENVFNEDR